MQVRKICILSMLLFLLVIPLGADVFTLATWNIRILSDNSRDDGELQDIAEILSRYDITAVQEVRDTRVLDRLMEIMGPEWAYAASEPVGRGVKEIYAYVYDTRLIEQTTPVYIVEDSFDLFIREPAYAGFRAEKTDFILASIHVVYGDRVADRREEIAWLDDILKLIDSQFPDEHDIILAGDFNMDSDDGSWELHDYEFVVDSETMTTITDTSSYDNIWLHREHTYGSEYAGLYEIYAFDELVFGNDDRTASLRVSDHRPVAIYMQDSVDDDRGIHGMPAAAVVFAPEGADAPEAEQEEQVQWDSVYISRVIKSPTPEETVYLYNPLDETITLSGWTIGDLNKPRALSLDNLEIDPYETLVLTRSKLNFQINNRDEELFLHNARGELVYHWTD